MAQLDTGVPTSIAHSYANPNVAMDAAMRAIPQGQQIGIEQQNTDIRKEATDAQIGQENQRIDLAKLAEERQQALAGAQLQSFALKNALDTALFQTHVDQQKAFARNAVISANLQERDWNRSQVNDPQMATILDGLSTADHEALARGDLDQQFTSQIRGLVGYEAQAKAHAAFDAAKQQSLDLVQKANQFEFDPDLRQKFNDEWSNAARGAKANIFNNYQILQNERQLGRQVDDWNKAVRFDAPSLTIDLNDPRLKMPDGRPNVPGVKAALEQGNLLYNRDKALYEAGMAEDKGLLDERTKINAQQLKNLEGTANNLQTNLQKIAAARSRETPNPLAGMTGKDGQPLVLPVTDKERNQMLNDLQQTYQTQLNKVYQERDALTQSAPHADFDKRVKKLQTAVWTARVARDQVAADPNATDDQKKQADKEANSAMGAAQQEFENWLGRPGSAKIYDGSLRYNPALPALQGSTYFDNR